MLSSRTVVYDVQGDQVLGKHNVHRMRIEVTRASRGLSAIAELLVQTVAQKVEFWQLTCQFPP